MKKDQVKNCGCLDNNNKVLNSSLRKIPKEMKFHWLPRFEIIAPGRSIPNKVRLYGYVVFTFEPTDQAELYVVKVKDVGLRCYPFIAPIDIDNDGRLEGIEIKNIEIGSEIFDLEACKGTVNVETNYFEIDWVIKLTPRNLPILEAMKEKVIEVKIPDRGYLDFKKGKFEIHRGVFEADKGPIAGYMFLGSATGEVGIVQTEINLNVAIATPNRYGCGDTDHKTVTICDGDKIFLCWKASNDADSVSITPGAYYNLNLQGDKIITPKRPSGSSSITYTAEAEGGATEAKDTVSVDFYDGKELEFQAAVDWLNNCFHIDLPPEAYSMNIIVEDFIIDTGPGCFDWKRIHVEYKPPPPPIGPSSPPGFGFNVEGYDPVGVSGKHTVCGTWQIYLLNDFEEDGKTLKQMPDLKDVNKPFCFKLKCKCLDKT